MNGPPWSDLAAPGGMSLVQESHDVEVLRKAALAAGWSAEYRQLGSGPLMVRNVVARCADMLVVSQQADRSLEVVGMPPAGVLTVMIPAPGDDFWVNGYSINYTELIVLAPGVELYAVTRSAVRICAVHIPGSLLDASVGDFESHRESFERGWVIPIAAGTGEPDSLGRLVELLHMLPAREDELASVLTSRLVPLIKESNNVGPIRDQHGRAHRWLVLSRARMYIDHHLGGTVRMADLCRNAGASSRTVERVFQQELQMTPTAYIRVRRLNAVKRELMGPAGAEKSITEIALFYGFGHHGRFSAAYREHFGHSPSDELKRADSLR